MTAAHSTAPPTEAVVPPAERASGWRRIAGISASLVGSQALTSGLGLVFWTIAARGFPTTSVGVSAAAVSMMTLLGSLGSLGLGTLLISRLPRTPAGERRVLVRTCLLAAGLGGAALALVVPLVAIHAFGADNLSPVAGTAAALLGLVVGTGLASVVLVLDQAVLTIGVGSLQLERNTAASVIKILALVALAAAGAQDGMSIFLAWTIGTLGSLPLVAWRTRGGNATATDRRFVRPELLRGLGRSAISHHALNTTLQGAMQILPIIVTLVLTVDQNAVFNTALMVCGLVFALPYAIAIGIFAAARGDEHGVLSRLPMTVGASMAVSVAAYAVLYPLAGFVLALFGPEYVEGGTPLLRLLALAGPAFVIKDHYVALRRVQDRTTNALRLLAGFLVVELVASAMGALLGGAEGLCAAWVSVLFGEALVLAVPLWRAWRQHVPGAAARQAPSVAEPTSFVPVVPRALPAAPAAPPRALFGPILLLMSVGVAVMGVGAAIARGGEITTAAQVAWVLGQVLIVAPATYRIVGAASGAGERVGLAVAAGILLQLSRTVLYPVHFAFHDEQLHMTTWRQLHDSGQLFALNPLLPVSGYYPGLELVTDALVRLAGLPVFAAATLVLLAARVVIMLALIGLVRVLTGSGRAAAIAAVVYLCNPQLLFFNSQFSYQTLALPLAVFTAYAFVVRRRDTRGALVLPLLGLLGVVVTHHLTAMLLVGALAVWLLGELLFGGRSEVGAARRRWRRLEVRHLAVLTAVGGAAVLLGVLNPGNPAGNYLGEIFTASGSGVADLATSGDIKPTFTDGVGVGPAPWERLLLNGSVLVSALAMLAAVARFRVGTRTGDVAGIVMALLALLYPVIPGSHLTEATAEAGDRAAGFVYIGLGAVVGWWLCRHRQRPWQLATITALLVLAFLGGVVLGAGPTARQLPGPYLVSADARSMDADNLAAAQWLAGFVPPDSRVFADRIGGLLASSDGRQFTVRHLSTRIDASRLLLDPAFTDADVALIREASIDYLIVDLRISSTLPNLGVYVETGEYEGRTRTAPVPAAALAKFAAVPGVDRIYDNGSVQVYDVRRLRDAG